jgi:4-amino-4-deoxy-L-arabinose transferase-like glycosyltransferase
VLERHCRPPWLALLTVNIFATGKNKFDMAFLASNWRRTLLFIFVLALLARGAFILTQQDGFYFPDSTIYSGAAVNLLTTGDLGANYVRAPGYPVFLAAMYTLFGEGIFGIRVVESIMGAFLAIIIAVIGRRVGGESVGALAGIIWSIYPLGVFIAGLVYPTGLATTLLACGVWCALPVSKQEFSAKKIFFAGLFFGLAALTIPVVLLTILVLAVWALYWARHSRFLLASLLLLGSALPLAPWTARSFVVHGQPIAIRPSVDRHLPRIRTGESDDPDDKIRAILRRPDLYLVNFAKEFLRFWELYPDRIKMSQTGYRENWHEKDSRVISSTIYTPNPLINIISILTIGPVFLFALLGAATMWLRRERRRDLSLFLLTIFSFAVGCSLFVGRLRYRIPVEPYIIILSAYGLAAAYEHFSQRYNWPALHGKNIRAERAA